MKVFKDVFTDDELCSDSFPMKIVDDLIYEFKGKHVVRKEGEITLSGSNPSAEEADEGTDEHVERGIDFVLNHHLQEMSCYTDITMFKSYIKEFVKKVVDYLEKEGKPKDEVDAFKKKIQGWVVSILSKDRFKNLQFFIGTVTIVVNGYNDLKGEKMAEGQGEGQVAIVEYRNDENGEEHPYLLLLKDAIVEEKF